MTAGRLPWLCQGTTPPGCTTSLRSRSMRFSARAFGSLARSTAPITSSVTLAAGVLFIGRTSGPDLSAGQDPASAGPASAAASPAAAKSVLNCIVSTFPVPDLTAVLQGHYPAPTGVE